MSIPIRFLPVLTCVLMLLDGRTASAATPTPTLTPVPVSTATPVPPQPAEFAVVPWENGQNTAHEVTAWIGETLCATGVPAPGAGTLFSFSLSVPSEEVLPGCGHEGAVVTFFVDGQRAPQTAVWHARPFEGSFVGLQVIIGPPFARFSGGVGPGRLSPRQVILPYIGSGPCGHGRANDPGDGYDAVVYSAEQQAGCGVEGTQIAFKLLDAQGNVIAVGNERGTWHAWDGLSDPQKLDLTFGPAGGVTMPNTGTGDGPEQATAPWGPLALSLSSLGLTGGIALAFRRRAMKR